MALKLTKQVTCVWDDPVTSDDAYREAREAFINQCVAEGITDGVWNGDVLTSIRNFTDQEAAERFLKGWIAIHTQFNRPPISTTITDI